MQNKYELHKPYKIEVPLSRIKMQPCKSTIIHSFAYVKKDKQLYIAFRDKTVYRYDNVENHTFVEFQIVSAPQRYLVQHINRNHHNEQVNGFVNGVGDLIIKA